MSLIFKSSRFARALVPRTSVCLYTTDADKGAPEAAAAPKTQPPQKPVESSTAPVDNTKYRCEIYYEHNEMSFYDIESQMAASRVGQPSSLTK